MKYNILAWENQKNKNVTQEDKKSLTWGGGVYGEKQKQNVFLNMGR